MYMHHHRPLKVLLTLRHLTVIALRSFYVLRCAREICRYTDLEGRLMGSKWFASSSSSSKGKGKFFRGEEEDLLGRLGLSNYGCGGRGSVDCSLRLGLPGTAASPPPSAGSVVRTTHIQLGPAGPPPPPSSELQTSFFVSELCTMCAATDTPLWRRGPYGPKSLCNACGIRYKKEERRLTLSLGLPSPNSKSRRQQQKNHDNASCR